MSEDRGSQFDDRPALDRAIDAAVREMVGIEPRAGLRARVLRRIEGNETASAGAASAFRRKVLWTGVPLAAAATLILALLLPSRTAEQPPAAPTVATVEPPRVPPPAPLGPASAPPLVKPRAPAARVVAAKAPRAAATPERVVAAASFAPPAATTDIEPLNPITPIEVASIAVRRVAPADISIRPLDPIVEVQIAPLSPPERRN
jgi:hypothetical protein